MRAFPRSAPDAPGLDAVTVEVPDIDIVGFHGALVADKQVQNRVDGGSVTTDQALIPVTGIHDVRIARQLINEAAGRWQAATIRYGKREFVE